MKEKILLGYEVKTGEPVEVENTHILVTGLTNKSGKTTTIEALASRSGRKVLVFATKPGEAVFANHRLVPPFYQEKSDWQYVSSILEAVMKERMRFERAWIIRATKGTKTLKEVDANCQQFANLSNEGSLENNIFSTLHAYFGIVLPQLKRIVFSSSFPDLKVGINVMNLTGMRDEVQSLIIRACLDHIGENEKGIITVIPELWKFAPEGRGNPVKIALEALIRQGATNQNFVWMDSQDIAGVEKLPLKQVYTWLLGLQTERNEVKHTLDQLPLPKKSKPGPDAIMTLQLGRFILATPCEVRTVYVAPSWMKPGIAIRIAKGLLSVNAEYEQDQAFDEIPLPWLDSRKSSEESNRKIRESLGKPALPESESRAPEVMQQSADEAPILPAQQVQAEDLPQAAAFAQSAAEEQTPGPVEEIELIEKQLIIKIQHDEEILMKISTRSKAGACVAVFQKNKNQPMRRSEICREMAEYGIRLFPANFLRDIGDELIAKGWLVPDGECYRLPRELKFVFVNGSE